MSTNVEKLTQAGILGTPHTISSDDHASIESLSDSEVNTLIGVKAKLSGGSTDSDQRPPVLSNTVSF